MNNQEVNILAEKLDNFPTVNRFNSGDEKESIVIARAFQEINESFNKIYQEILPKIYKATTNDEIVDLLSDVGEEYRHIMYHIKDGSYFEYLP